MARHTTLYVSDMDGTLLGSDSLVSATSAAMLTDLARRGVLFTVATARTPATVVPLLTDTATLAEPIVMTGAALWNRADDRMEDVRTIPSDHVARVLNLFSEASLHPFVYTMNSDGRRLDVYHGAIRLSKAEESFYLQRSKLKLKTFHLGHQLPADSFRRVILFYALGPATTVNPIARELRASIDLAVSCYPDIFNPQLSHLEILVQGVSKAEAIRRVAERHGADRIVVFGDNLNDLPMFGIADIAVAVENAQPEVKAAADLIIGPNYTDAVPAAIDQLESRDSLIVKTGL